MAGIVKLLTLSNATCCSVAGHVRTKRLLAIGDEDYPALSGDDALIKRKRRSEDCT